MAYKSYEGAHSLFAKWIVPIINYAYVAQRQRKNYRSLVVYVNFVLCDRARRIIYARRYIFFLKNLAFDFQHFSKKKRVFRDAILLIDSVGREWVDSAYQLDRQSVYREGNLELFDSVPNQLLSFLASLFFSSDEQRDPFLRYFSQREENETSGSRIVHINQIKLIFKFIHKIINVSM